MPCVTTWFSGGSWLPYGNLSSATIYILAMLSELSKNMGGRSGAETREAGQRREFKEVNIQWH